MSLINKQSIEQTKLMDQKIADMLQNEVDSHINEQGKLWELDDDHYRASVGINASSLADVRRSPAHYYAHQILGIGRETTPAMEFGSLVHSAILEPHTLHEKYINDQEFVEAVIQDKPDTKSPRATKVYKDLVNNAKLQGKTVLTDKDFTSMSNIVDAVYSHQTAKNILNNGHPEKVLYAQDPDTGLLLKGKMDFILSDGYVVDVKTTKDASRAEFTKSLFNYNYYVQAAFYLHIAKLSLGQSFKNFLFICIEKDEPHQVAIYTPDEGALDAGERVFKRDLRILSECYEKNQWPGYSSKIENIALPHWAFNHLEDYIDG